MPGRVVHVDWPFEPSGPGDYATVPSDRAGVVVGVGTAMDGSAGHVTAFVEVPDIDAAIAAAERLGGRVAMPVLDVGHGRIALVADPEGHVIGLSQF